MSNFDLCKKEEKFVTVELFVCLLIYDQDFAFFFFQILNDESYNVIRTNQRQRRNIFFDGGQNNVAWLKDFFSLKFC